MEKYTALCDVDPGMKKHPLGNIWMPSCYPADGLEAALKFQLRDTDILTATYPKTGQTWLLTILYLMDNSEKLERGETIEKEDRLAVPFFEMQYLDEQPREWELIEQIPDPRTIKTHLPLCYWKDALDKSPGTKVIQTVRNPKDTLVSLYHFCRMNQYFGWFNGTWDQFFETVVDGEMISGDLFQTTANWYNYNKERENSLILVYEDMKKDLNGNLKKLSDFLGKNLSKEVLQKIAEKTTFENMSADPKLNKSNIPTFKDDRAPFLRKGKVGDWKEYFSNQQSDFCDTKCQIFFEPIGLKFEYE